MQWIEKKFGLAMQKSICWISKSELIDSALLIQKGYSMKESFQIVGVHETILTKLDQGDDWHQFLNINKRDPFYVSFSFFLDVMPFHLAVISTNDYVEMKKNLRNNWLKEIAYPIFTLFFAILVFIIFNQLIYPQLCILTDLKQDHMKLILDFMMNILSVFILLIVLISMFISFLFHHKKDWYYLFYQNFFYKLSLVRKLISYDYTIHSLVLMKQGYSTKQVFECLQRMKTESFLAYDIKEMMNDFHQGKEMIEIIMNHPRFDHRFKYLFKIGYYGGNLEERLEDYVRIQEKEFHKLLRKSTQIITLSAYSFIGFLVIVIYQMLLIPLNIIEQF